MSRRGKITIALLLLLIVGVVVVLAVNIVTKPYVHWVSTVEVQRKLQGDLFALEAFLQQQSPDTPVRKWRHWRQALRRSGGNEGPVLLWLESTRRATEEEYASLFEWVEEGNHVVLPLPEAYLSAVAAQVSADEEADEEAATTGITEADYRLLLQEYLGLTLAAAAKDSALPLAEVQTACQAMVQGWHEAAAAVEDTIEETDEAHALQRCQGHANRIKLPEGRTVVWYDGSATSERADTFKPVPGQTLLWQGEGVHGSRIVRVPYGEGSVIMVTYLKAWLPPQNPLADDSQINQFDHAYLAAYLAADKEAVWLVRDLGSKDDKAAAPAWWRLWQAQPLLMFSLLLFLAAGVWHVAVRMGARRQLPLAQERDLSEHLRAQGRFESQMHARASQLAWMQQQLWQQWRQQWSHWPQMSAQERLQTVCRHSGLPPSVVHIWLEPLPAKIRHKDWLHYIRAHRRLVRPSRAPSRPPSP